MSEQTNYASNHDAVGELWQRCKEQQAEIERLRGALLACSSLAGGQMHAYPSDRCASICEVVKNAFAAKAAGGDDE